MKRIKKLTAIVLTIALLISMMPSTNVQAAKRVKLNKKRVTLYVGKTVKLKVKNYKKKVKWSSSNKKVATVNKKGKVRAKRKGKAVITAKVGKKRYKCKVTVKNENNIEETRSYPATPTNNNTTPTNNNTTTTTTADKSLKSISISQTSYEMLVGLECLLPVVNFNPVDTTDSKRVTWTSSNSSIVSVYSYLGKMEAKAAGTATITAKVGNCTASFTVTVYLPVVMSYERVNNNLSHKITYYNVGDEIIYINEVYGKNNDQYYELEPGTYDQEMVMVNKNGSFQYVVKYTFVPQYVSSYIDGEKSIVYGYDGDSIYSFEYIFVEFSYRYCDYTALIVPDGGFFFFDSEGNMLPDVLTSGDDEETTTTVQETTTTKNIIEQETTTVQSATSYKKIQLPTRWYDTFDARGYAKITNTSTSDCMGIKFDGFSSLIYNENAWRYGIAMCNDIPVESTRKYKLVADVTTSSPKTIRIQIYSSRMGWLLADKTFEKDCSNLNFSSTTKKIELEFVSEFDDDIEITFGFGAFDSDETGFYDIEISGIQLYDVGEATIVEEETTEEVITEETTEQVTIVEEETTEHRELVEVEQIELPSEWSMIFDGYGNADITDTSTEDAGGVKLTGFEVIYDELRLDNVWQGQAQYTDIAVQKGKTYKLVADVSATPSKQLFVQAASSSYYYVKEETFASENRHIEMIFSPTVDSIQITFAFGAMDSSETGTYDIELSNVKLYEIN